LAILTAAESWYCPPTYRIQAKGDQGDKFKAATPKLLYGFIAESQALGGTVVDQFWDNVGQCHPRLVENIEILRHAEFTSIPHSETVLFEEIDRETIDFRPVFEMGAELFTHLGIAFKNPGGRKSGGGTPFSVSDLIAKDTDELLEMAATSKDFGNRKQEILKILALKRDGESCPLTGLPFDEKGVTPILAHIIPNSVHNKPDTIRCIAMLAGTAVRDVVVQQLNGLGNVMNIQSDAHIAYDNIRWGIEASNVDGVVEYIYRRVPKTVTTKGPGLIRFSDGDQIPFGGGPEAAQLGFGPNPSLCNLQLAVARVLRMSGAAEIIEQIMDDGDDSDFPHVYVAAPAFCNILTAQLQLAGGVLP